MELKYWIHAYQRSTYDKEIVKQKYEGEKIYCIPGNWNNKLSKRDCTKYFETLIYFVVYKKKCEIKDAHKTIPIILMINLF